MFQTGQGEIRTAVAGLSLGPMSAAQLLVSWSHKGRCRSEAAFAALAGTSPLEVRQLTDVYHCNLRHSLSRNCWHALYHSPTLEAGALRVTKELKEVRA